MCLSKGQQTLSEEVSERTRSRMLKLEKENQSLLRTVEELRAASVSNSPQSKHSYNHKCDHVCKLACGTNNSTSSMTTLQTSCPNVENHTNVFSHCTITDLNRDLNCHQQLNFDELEGVQSEIIHTNNSDLQIQEKGQLEDGVRGDHFKELMSDLEVLENSHNRLHCFVGSHDHSPGSKSSSPCHDSTFTGLPTRSSYARHTQRLEAKCRALDTVNQHLQTSLDNTGMDSRSTKH